MTEIHIWDLTDADVQLLIAAVRCVNDLVDFGGDCFTTCGCRPMDARDQKHEEDCPIRLALEALAVKPSEVEHG
jgi:hypothetical protein